MKSKRACLGIAFATALAAAPWAAPCAAQGAVAGGSAAASEETKVIQGVYVSLAATEALFRQDSPFLNPYWNQGDWYLSGYTYDSYSLSFRARGVSGQVSAWVDADSSEALSGAISQAWIKATFGEGWAIAFGRHELAWKDGGYWNPSDVVNSRLSWDQKGEAAGSDSVELIGLLPFMDFNLDINAATAFAAGADDLEELPLYLAVGSILYPFELRAKAAFQADRLPLLGGAVKLSLTGIDLYGDLIWLQDRPLARELDPSFAAEEGSWLRFCVGGSWSADISRSKIAKSLSLRLEYLHQGDGLTKDQGSQFIDYLGSVRAIPTYMAWSAAYNAWDDRFFSLYRDYAFLALSLYDIGNAHLGFDASGLANLDDWSLALRGTLSWSPKNLMKISLGATGYLGPEGSEARALPKAFECSVKLSKSF
jgi:hypothetical protein